MPTIKVYLENALMDGPISCGRSQPARSHRSRYLDGSEATQRWGLDHDLGAIVVSTRN